MDLVGEMIKQAKDKISKANKDELLDMMNMMNINTFSGNIFVVKSKKDMVKTLKDKIDQTENLLRFAWKL